MPSDLRRILIASSLIVWSIAFAAEEPATVSSVPVATELEKLMSEHGFEVRGIEQTVDAMARAEGDGLLARLHMLLENFDYVLVQTPDGGIERVLILGEKVAYVPPPLVVESDAPDPDSAESSDDEEIVLPTQRKGPSHLLTLTLEGPNEQQVKQILLIDTGADQVVLPASLVASLGLDVSTLRDQQVQTANGSVDARVGTLPAIWLGDTRVPDVSAAFIDDQRLGGHALLGMNVLGRFRITIDDVKNQVTLASK
ncbi:retropepsin-like aspartic protease [uncultured Thiocystis sp.]|jgi:clan AA aspartic protease (TIGR02281 family)|uniref:retropepsin-like aspartic protease family protein n=1 Tax=uncultured Thiocystis sp. TaxID=1202134 RepID=UPI0025D2307C|nr:retropepsin-like aspartic protease [uncultured Thiocystis sp.]